MNRRLGISILSVLSLTTGVLVAEHAFAPLRAPTPVMDAVSPPSAPEPTASPREATPSAPTNQSQHTPPPVERRNAVGEAEGDPMVADARAVIDSVWQNAPMSIPKDLRVTLASTAALAGRESPARAMPTLGAGVGSIGLGGTFLGTQRARGSVLESTGAPGADSSAESGVDAVVSDAPPANPGIVPEEPLAMNDAPIAPVSEDMSIPTAPPTDGQPSMEPVTGGDATSEPQMEGTVPTKPRVSLPNDLGLEPLPQVTVPEPLPTSLFLFGILLGVLSRRRRHRA